jgi:hypothetical protein
VPGWSFVAAATCTRSIEVSLLWARSPTFTRSSRISSTRISRASIDSLGSIMSCP